MTKIWLVNASKIYFNILTILSFYKICCCRAGVDVTLGVNFCLCSLSPFTVPLPDGLMLSIYS